MYLKPLVTNSRNVALVEDIFAMGYVGGGGAEFFKSNDDYINFVDSSGNARAKCSLMSALVPYCCSEMQNPIDVTGQLPSNMVAPGSGEGGSGGYPNAAFLKNRFNLRSPMEAAASEPEYFQARGLNTICWQGHQVMFNPATNSHDLVVTNTGHWGPNVYPGCGAVRKGNQKFLQEVQHSNMYGGSAKATYHNYN